MATTGARTPAARDDDPLGPSLGRPAPVPRWAELLATLLDDAIAIPGTKLRFGLDGIVGMFLPGAGDAVTALGAGALLLLAVRRRVPTSVLVRMLFNIAIDACVGAIPVLGDVFDFANKSNRRNLELLKGQPQEPSERRLLGDVLLLGVGFLLLAACVVLPILLWVLLFQIIQR